MKITLPQVSYTYSEYVAMVEALQLEGKVTGHQQSESLLAYSKLNMHRMHRWEKTFIPSSALVRKIQAIDKPMHWVVITEGWCGDAAQQLPVIEKLATQNPLITTHYVLRDDNPDFMDLFLTNGARAIPVWICTDEEWNVRWTWGARPRAAQEMLNKLKEAAVSIDEQKQELHSWYAKNKHEALQLEVAQILDL
ncbi:MAG: thioredoxin family protein [Flavobacteriales bacterium]